jgi:predicted nuclease with RNAse H fold
MLTNSPFMKTFFGVDLSASPKKKSAYAVLYEDLTCVTGFFKHDDELVEKVEKYSPEVVGIDAPLSFPQKGYYRLCEKALRRLGIRAFSPIFEGMRSLTLRAIQLRSKLEKRGYEVIEIYPGGTQDMLGLPRKNKSREKLYLGLRSLGLRFPESRNGDLLDAVTAALTVFAYKKEEYILVSSSDGCRLVLASPSLKEALLQIKG